MIGLILAFTLVFADSNTQTELDIHIKNNNCVYGCYEWTISVENENNIYDALFDYTTDYDTYSFTYDYENITIRGNHIGSLQGGANFTFGYGKYKITLQSSSGGTHIIYVDFGDCNYPYTGLSADMIITYYFDTNTIKYYFTGTEYVITEGNTVHIWDQSGGPSSPETYCFDVTPVSNLSWSNYNNKVKLNWNSSGSGINYDVWRSINGSTSTMIGNSFSNTNYVDNYVQVCCGSIVQTNVYEVFAEFQGTTPSNAGPLTVKTKINRFDKTLVQEATKFHISKPFPNPFNPIVNIDYEIPDRMNIQIIIYTLTGELIYSNKLIHSPGFYSFMWNGKDIYGNKVSSGVYIFTMKGNGIYHSEKLILLQ
jgi:hypothetical protein